jgi:preprotein translocase subunit SecF
MVLFGGDVLRGFSLALLIGIVFGTYSSIAIASPIMVWWQQRLDAGRVNTPSTKSGTTAGGATPRSTSKAKAAAL